MAINSAIDLVRRTGNLPVPLPIRNAPTKLMADLGYHDGYKYPHDYPDNFTTQQYLPMKFRTKYYGILVPMLLKIVLMKE